MHDEIMARGAHLTTTHVQSVAIAEFVVRSALDYFHDAPSWWAGHEQRSWERRRFREIYGTTCSSSAWGQSAPTSPAGRHPSVSR
jgi:phosphoglycerate dehydrogenase-like enzyme